MIEIVYCTHSMDALFWGPYNIQQNGFSVLPDVRTSVYVYSEKKNWICDWWDHIENRGLFSNSTTAALYS